MSQQYDFVAIGDILIDAFIQLNTDHANVMIDQDTGRKTLTMQFGSKLPYDDVRSVIVGVFVSIFVQNFIILEL